MNDFTDLPLREHRALVEAGYAPLPEYLKRLEQEEVAEKLSLSNRLRILTAMTAAFWLSVGAGLWLVLS